MARTDRTDNTEVLVIRKERIKRFPGLHMALIVWCRDQAPVLSQTVRQSEYQTHLRWAAWWLVKILTLSTWEPVLIIIKCTNKLLRSSTAQRSQISQLKYKLPADIKTLKTRQRWFAGLNQLLCLGCRPASRTPGQQR